MEAKIKEVTVYVSTDGKEFNTPKECKYHEAFTIIENLHKKLITCDFHSGFKIVPYFHNRDITHIGKHQGACWVDTGLHNTDASYVLMHGRMGNGNCRVRYKKRGDSILLIRYNTDGQTSPVYLGKIPYSWTLLEMGELQAQVDTYLANRKVFVKEVNYTTNVTYKQI